jgi:hypothetical protein
MLLIDRHARLGLVVPVQAQSLPLDDPPLPVFGAIALADRDAVRLEMNRREPGGSTPAARAAGRYLRRRRPTA